MESTHGVRPHAHHVYLCLHAFGECARGDAVTCRSETCISVCALTRTNERFVDAFAAGARKLVVSQGAQAGALLRGDAHLVVTDTSEAELLRQWYPGQLCVGRHQPYTRESKAILIPRGDQAFSTPPCHLVIAFRLGGSQISFTFCSSRVGDQNFWSPKVLVPDPHIQPICSHI